MEFSKVTSHSITKVYNSIAKEFKDTRHYNWQWVTDFIEKYVNKDNYSKNVLDIGCGSGRNIKAYNTDKIKVVGLDNSEEFIKICQNEDLDVVLSDMTTLPFPDNYFDNILSIASFHHLVSNTDRLNALKEISRVLKPKETLILSVWSKTQPAKTKRKFENCGDNMVPWKSLTGKVFQRYYYIFEISELKTLFLKTNFSIISHKWECGNDVFILENNK